MKKLGLVAVLVVFLSTLAAPAHAQTKADLAADFGPAGVWLLTPDGDSSQLDPSSPEEMASGDVDGNGQSDLILDFPGEGVWIWLNNSQWLQVHALNAAHIVTADLDGNGRAAVLLDFPGRGIWVWRNNGNWTQLHGLNAHAMATGDLDGNGRAEVLIDFTGHGVWVWTNNQSWSQLHGLNVTSIAVGDLDGNGRKDVLLDFPGHGPWVWGNNASWSQLHGLSASHMTLADLDGNGQDEAIIDFPGYGLWVWGTAGWWRLHTLDAEALTAADLDGNGRSDLVIDFGPPGLWGWWNNASWTQLHAQSPEGSVARNFYRPPPITFSEPEVSSLLTNTQVGAHVMHHSNSVQSFSLSGATFTAAGTGIPFFKFRTTFDDRSPSLYSYDFIDENVMQVSATGLDISFAAPTNTFSFGAALNATSSPSQMQIELLGLGNTSLGLFNLTLDRTVLSIHGGTNSNSEGLFIAPNVGPITGARLRNFGDGTANGSAFNWVIDYVDFQSKTVPELTSPRKTTASETRAR